VKWVEDLEARFRAEGDNAKRAAERARNILMGYRTGKGF
jgi:hypothetical protein